MSSFVDQNAGLCHVPAGFRQGLVAVLHLNSEPVSRNRFNFIVRSIVGIMTRYLFFPTGTNRCEKETLFRHALFYPAWRCWNLMKLRRAYARAVSPCGRVPVSTKPLAIQQGALALLTIIAEIGWSCKFVAIPPHVYKPGDYLPHTL